MIKRIAREGGRTRATIDAYSSGYIGRWRGLVVLLSGCQNKMLCRDIARCLGAKELRRMGIVPNIYIPKSGIKDPGCSAAGQRG